MRMRVPRSASICLFAVAFALASADESNAQNLSPAMLCSWSQLHQPSQSNGWPAAGASVNAQSQFAPYYGKNQIHYDKFEWYIYKTDHFEIYYYPENEPHLERVASYAESAYQHVSSDLRHDLASACRSSSSRPTASSSSRTSPRAVSRKACWRSPKASATAWCCRSISRRTCSTG